MIGDGTTSLFFLVTWAWQRATLGDTLCFGKDALALRMGRGLLGHRKDWTCFLMFHSFSMIVLDTYVQHSMCFSTDRS